MDLVAKQDEMGQNKVLKRRISTCEDQFAKQNRTFVMQVK